MNDATPKPLSELEPERLIAAVPSDSPGTERLWTSLESRLAADQASAPRKKEAKQPDEPIRRRWWIEVLTGIAAFFLFALMLGGRSPRLSVKHHTPVEDGKTDPANEPDPAPLLEQLKADSLQDRHQAFITLLRGGTKTRAAVAAFKAGTDAEQNRAVEELRKGFAQLEQFRPITEAETLPFWQALWNAEAAVQPNVWDVGLDLTPADEQPTAAPSQFTADLLAAKYGEAQGRTLQTRFADTFQTLRKFQKWERHQNPELLDVIAKTGVPVAPVVLHILGTPEATEITVPRYPGLKGTFPSDHLRMFAAAVRLKLHEAEPLILQFTGGYFSSGTIQGNAINALWQLGGHTEKPFPLDVAIPSKEEVEAVQTWWHENHPHDPQGAFEADIDAFLAGNAGQSETALLKLLRGGDAARAAVRADARAQELQRVRKLFEVLATLGADTESLDFWKELWDDEAYLEPWLWAYGINGEGTSFPKVDERANKPKLLSGTPEVLPALRAKFGDERGLAIAKRFAAAYQAYVNFRHWSRPPMGEKQTAEQNQRLDAMAAAGLAAAPPIFKLLSQPVANMIEKPEQEQALEAIAAGKIPPLPTSLDHLRMIVAAERMKLHAAELLIVEKVAISYPMSRTIQEHAVAAVYRLHGDTDVIKNFPFDIATNDYDWFATFFAWWLEQETKSTQADLASGNATRIAAARETVSDITRLLPRMEDWRKLIADQKKWPQVEARLAKAIDAFKQANPQRAPAVRKAPPARAEDERSEKKKDERW